MQQRPCDADLVRHLATEWQSTRAWVERMLADTLGLEHAHDVLQTPHRGRRQIPGTPWWYRTHGIGVDVSQPGNKGGIDFDFDKPDPDDWRLREFMIKQLNAGRLPAARYRPLLQDEARWHAAFDAWRATANSDG